MTHSTAPTNPAPLSPEMEAYARYLQSLHKAAEAERGRRLRKTVWGLALALVLLSGCAQSMPSPRDARAAAAAEWERTFGPGTDPAPVTVEVLPWWELAAHQNCKRTGLRGCFRHSDRRVIVSDTAPACHTTVHEFTHVFEYAMLGIIPPSLSHGLLIIWGPGGVMRRAEMRLCGETVP